MPGNAGQLGRAVANLVDNAVRHARSRVTVTLEENGDGEAVLAVADDGPGMNGSGDGTGLSIVRALVREELQGTIALTSEPGFRAEVVFPT